MQKICGRCWARQVCDILLLSLLSLSAFTICDARSRLRTTQQGACLLDQLFLVSNRKQIGVRRSLAETASHPVSSVSRLDEVSQHGTLSCVLTIS